MKKRCNENVQIFNSWRRNAPSDVRLSPCLSLSLLLSQCLSTPPSPFLPPTQTASSLLSAAGSSVDQRRNWAMRLSESLILRQIWHLRRRVSCIRIFEWHAIFKKNPYSFKFFYIIVILKKNIPRTRFSNTYVKTDH